MTLLPNYVLKDESILELGCNCGRNLQALYLEGYYDLSGIDINASAFNYGAIQYPDLYSIAEFYTESIESWMKTNPLQYDCIFTMAVLEHIPKGSEWIFHNIAHKARHTIITVEDEQSVSERHFPRNYQAVFDALGWRQLLQKQAGSEDELTGLTARIFTRKVKNAY
jgi:2-polyprenyl-3-methyl-5-hydroxy-6-metoxy-1,4-benzoquinol methylase